MAAAAAGGQLLDNFITETAREKAEIQKTEVEELRAKDNMCVLGVCSAGRMRCGFALAWVHC